MRILVLGGCGIQGKTAIFDLAGDDSVQEVICADVDLAPLDEMAAHMDMTHVRPVSLDASDAGALDRLFQQADVAIDLLPRRFMEAVCQAAIRNGVSVVNTNYAKPIAHLNDDAVNAGVAVMPECGLDPGIDLVLYGDAGRRFDELHVINSYCGGLPEPSACDNPMKYKVSWVFEGVLASTKRDGRIIRDGSVVEIPGTRQHDPDNVHNVDFPGLGNLEAIPNGDAVFFTDALGVTSSIRETGRYSLRWPGWSAFWRPLKALNFLSEDPVDGLPCAVSPYQLIERLVGPQIQYKRNEKDLVAMLNVFEGRKAGRRVRLVSRLLIERDLETGHMAMAQGVSYPAGIAARMIADGTITAKGVLSPMTHIPCDAFMDALRERGIVIEEEETVLS